MGLSQASPEVFCLRPIFSLRSVCAGFADPTAWIDSVVFLSNIPDFDKLGLPKILRNVIKRPNGLILVTGPTGSGKSTSLAAMLDVLNREDFGHMITVEGSGRVYSPAQELYCQPTRSGSRHQSFGAALKRILRQDPDFLFSSVSCATSRQSKWRSPWQKPAIWFSAPCTRTAPFNPLTASSTLSAPPTDSSQTAVVLHTSSGDVPTTHPKKL